MKITDKLIPRGKYNRPGTKSEPKRVCVHYTGDLGASAERLALFFCTNVNATTSSQYVVGTDGEVIRCVPDDEIAYGASGKNAGTIHIEVCYKSADGRFEEASVKALNELVLYLMPRYHIAAKDVVRHYDLTGKHCPAYYVDAARWQELHERITSKPTASAPAPAEKKLYRVQVGAFSSRANAEAYAEKVKAAGFGAFVVDV